MIILNGHAHALTVTSFLSSKCCAPWAELTSSEWTHAGYNWLHPCVGSLHSHWAWLAITRGGWKNARLHIKYKSVRMSWNGEICNKKKYDWRRICSKIFFLHFSPFQIILRLLTFFPLFFYFLRGCTVPWEGDISDFRLWLFSMNLIMKVDYCC